MTSRPPASGTATQTVGRFAPSPSGPLHYGSLLAAVASYLNTRASGGIWLVRIDDLDPPREVAGAASDILQTLENYGLHWDGEILYQSQRQATYNDALALLEKKQLSYPCRCSRKDIRERGETVYQGHCRKALISTDEKHAIRIRVPEQRYEWEDMIQGRQSSNIFQNFGDFIVHRRDGLYAYHLAVVVDDAYQKITESIRGADLLPSTPAQIYLQEALGIKPPQYAHIPVAINEQGEKLSKRTGAAPVSENNPARTLFKALQDLGQKPPADLETSSILDILHWGEMNWDLEKIPTGNISAKLSP